MPQTTTKLPAGPELQHAGAPRVEIPATEHEPPPTRRRAREPEPRRDDDTTYESVIVDDRAPKMEPWLWVLLGAVASAALALFVPRSAHPPLFAVTGTLVLAGFGMLFVQERRSAVARRRRGA